MDRGDVLTLAYGIALTFAFQWLIVGSRHEPFPRRRASDFVLGVGLLTALAWGITLALRRP